MLALIGFLLQAFPPSSAAHTLDTEGSADISRQGENIRVELVLDYLSFATVAGVRAPGSGFAAVPAAELAGSRPEIAAYLTRNLRVFADGVACPVEVADTGIVQRLGEDHARVLLDFDCTGAGRYEFRYSVLLGDLDPGHRNLATYDLEGRSGRFVFDAEHQTLVVGEQGALGAAWRFAELGFDHILAGLDHVLFVVAFLIGARRVREVFGVVTAFTVAHSTTLVLTATGALSVTPRVVEPLIALSIAYVAAENCLARPVPRYRYAAVFAFGLLHGMGFAGALGGADFSSLPTVLGFNLGVEAGQALVVAAFLPPLLLLRRFSWGHHVRLAAASAIALLGLAWFVERMFV